MSRLAALKDKPEATPEDELMKRVRTAMGHALVDRELPPAIAQRLSGSRPICLLMRTPSGEHIRIVLEALRERFSSTATVHDVMAADTLYLLRRALLRGRHAIAIVETGDDLPDDLRVFVDETIDVQHVDPGIIIDTLKRLGKRSVRLPQGFRPNPSPEVICQAIAAGLATRRMKQFLERSGQLARDAQQSLLPSLEDCIEFGEAREWGLSVIEDYRGWQAGTVAAEDIDSALLLMSPPGHGKTYFARVVAKALDGPLIELTVGSVFANDGHLGPVLKDMRDKFALAQRSAPCVLLLDELDSFSRRDATDHNASFNASMINELLALVDGATKRSPGLVIIGATNRPAAIDPALMRPGRLSKQIDLPLPDAAGVEHILRTHLRGELADCDLLDMARLAHGRTSAELMDVVRKARQASRRAGRALHAHDLQEAILARHAMDPAGRERIALHEAGHAICATLLPDAPTVVSMTLVARGASLGEVKLLDPGEPHTRQNAEAMIVVNLAGRAAETLCYGGNPSAGSANDLKNSTKLLARMRLQWGMYDTLAHHEDIDQALALDDRLRLEVEGELQRLMQIAMDVLARNRPRLEALARALLEKHVLMGDEVRAIIQEAGAQSEMGLGEPAKALSSVSFNTEPYRASDDLGARA